MDVQKKLDEIVEAVGAARAMPMSASCVINRAQLLSLLEEVRQALPNSLAQAQELIGDREQLVAQAREEAGRIIETAHAERGTLVSDTEVARRSQAEAERIVAEARREADEIRVQADDYVDSKLANFEVVLTKTLGSVGRGREKLLGTGPGLDVAGYEDPDYAEAPERSQDPQTLRERADAYVDVKLGAFEAVLAKTLEAVGRGRQKLHGRVAADELGTLDVTDPDFRHTSDTEYLADLAEQGPASRGSQASRTPDGPPPPPPVPAQAPAGRQPTDPFADQQAVAQYSTQSYPQDAYAYSPQDAYAEQGAYQQQDAYSGTPDYSGTLGFSSALDFAGAGDTPGTGGTFTAGGAPLAQQDPYGYQQGYDPSQLPGTGGYDPLAGQPQGQPQADPAALDETSLFDTGMISAEQLRQYEQSRGYEQ